MDLVERRHVEAPERRQASRLVLAAQAFPKHGNQVGHEHLALAGGNHVGEGRQRLGIHERHGAADDDQRVPRAPRDGPRRQAGQPQHRDDVGVVPLEGDRERQDVEIRDGRLRLERQQRRAALELRAQFLLRRQEDALADDIIQVVEQPVDRLEPQAGHADPVRIWKRERDAEAATVRLQHVARFAGQNLPRALAVLPLLHVLVRRPPFAA